MLLPIVPSLSYARSLRQPSRVIHHLSQLPFTVNQTSCLYIFCAAIGFRLFQTACRKPSHMSPGVFLDKPLLYINTGITRENPLGLDHQSGVIGGKARYIPCETGQQN